MGECARNVIWIASRTCQFLEASAYTLINEGWEKFTANRVLERAAINTRRFIHCPDAARIPSPFIPSAHYTVLTVNMIQGLKVGPYQILERLGEGGMGVVHRALDTRLNRPVAIKVLSTSMATDPRASERLRRGAQSKDPP